MFGRLMLNRGPRLLLNSEPPNSLNNPNIESHLNTNEIVLIIFNEEIVSEYQVLTSIGIGWVHIENLVEA